MLADPATVTDLAERARATGRLGIDTEFMGEGRYQPLLCLVQVAVEAPDGSTTVAVLDPLDAALDPAPLAELLADPEIEIVLHAGRQDVALLRRVWGTDVTSIFDTQVAAGFAGLRAQLGYEALLHEMLGVRLRKSASFTRWDARPLSDEQVDYAREDVLHLLQLADALQATLADRGRLEWAREECRALEEASDERDPDALFARLPRVNWLDPAQRAVARELVAWRERTRAATPTGPPRASCRTPRSSRSPSAAPQRRAPRADPRPERGHPAPPRQGHPRRRRARPRAAADPGRRRARGAPRSRRRAADRAGRGARARPRHRGGAGLRADRGQGRPAAHRHRGAHGRRRADVRTLQGWRREVVGEELLELLRGRRALSVGPGRRIEVSERGAPGGGG